MRIDVTDHWTHACLAALLVGVAGICTGCADAAGSGGEQRPTEPDMQDTTLDVQPEFSLQGIADIPEALKLATLGFRVGHVTFIPKDGGESVVVDDPFEITFDLSDGQQVQRSQPVALPHPGAYAVELRLEPPEQQQPYTFRLDGRISPEIAEALSSSNPHQDGGDPIPDPFHPDDEETTEDGESPSWIDFEYRSERAISYRIDSVNLQTDRPLLRVELDIHDWARELIEPVAELARARDEASEGPDAPQTVDVTRTLDSTGRGYQSMAQDLRVEAGR